MSSSHTDLKARPTDAIAAFREDVEQRLSAARIYADELLANLERQAAELKPFNLGGAELLERAAAAATFAIDVPRGYEVDHLGVTLPYTTLSVSLAQKVRGGRYKALLLLIPDTSGEKVSRG